MCSFPVHAMFGINLAQRGIPLKLFLSNLALGREFQPPGPHHVKFHHYGFKNVGLEPKKSPKMVILV